MSEADPPPSVEPAPADATASASSELPDDWDLTEGAPAPASEKGPGPKTAVPALPDDWDQSEEVGVRTPASELRREAPHPPREPSSGISSPAAAKPVGPVPGRSPGVGAEDFTRRLMEAAGIVGPAEPIEDLAAIVGHLLAGFASGFVELLAARTSFKNELRIEATSIRPVENNPLKFSVEGSDALKHMILPTGAGFTPANESVQEAVTDLQDHQVAVLSAMRTALDALLTRLDPTAIEARCDEEGKSRLGLSGKGRYWDAYRELMAPLQEDPDAFFKEMFAEEFVRAYEQQIDLLSKSRR